MKRVKRIISIFIIFLLGITNSITLGQNVNAKDGKKVVSRKYIITVEKQEVKKVLDNETYDIVLDGVESNNQETTIVTANLTNDEEEEICRESAGKIQIEEDKYVRACNNKGKIYKRKRKEKPIKGTSFDWNKQMIRAQNIKREKNKKEIKIAVLDSGVDYGNDIELEYSINLVPGREDCSPLFMDNSGHGNSVAGLIAAKNNGKGVTGINPNAKIYSIAVLDENNMAPISRIIEGIYMAIDKDVDIINMSFGMDDYSPALEKAIVAAKKAGILMVAAAGNTGANVQYPAAFEDVLAVGSVDSKGNIATTSAKGKEIDVVAPGEFVMSTGELGDVIVQSGTSLAAPQIAAEASLLLEKSKKLDTEALKECIKQTANQCGNKEYYGNGIIDIKYALESVKRFENYDNNTKSISTNPNKVNTFEATGCVQGSWMKEGHESLIPSKRTYVKKGAIFSDKAKKFDKASDNPWWHGSGFFKNNNYVSAVIYNTRLADAYGGSKSLYSAKIPYKFDAGASEMRKDLKSITNWKAVLGVKATPGRQRAFVWGMAMHNLADAFAHNAYIKKKGKWVHLNHEIKYSNRNLPDADDTKVEKTRFEAAKASVDYALQIYDRKGKVTDGVFATKLNSKFKLYKFYTFLVEYNKGSKNAGKAYLSYSIKD